MAEVSHLLFDRTATDPDAVRGAVEGLLLRKLDEAPKRGKGARKRRFLRHCLATEGRWRTGLYVCYRKAKNKIPHTSNFIEGCNRIPKRHERRITGRASTAGGPVQSYGELYVPLVVEAKLKGFAAIRKRGRAAVLDPNRSAAARKKLDELAKPARQHRSVARRPLQFLKSLVDLAAAPLEAAATPPAPKKTKAKVAQALGV